MRSSRRIRVTARGRFTLRLPPEERALLASLPRQLARTLGELDTGAELPTELRRLFPTAYPTDEHAEAAFVALVRGDLAEHHGRALTTLVETAEASEVTAEQLESWLAALNDLRLVLGVALEVEEDSELPDADDPRFSEWLCYRYLSFLQGEVVEALADVLPPPTPGADDEELVDPWGPPPGGLRWDGTPAPGRP